MQKPGGQGGSLVDNLQLEDVVTIKTDSSASDVRQTALAWSPLADGRDGETAIRYVEMQFLSKREKLCGLQFLRSNSYACKAPLSHFPFPIG